MLQSTLLTAVAVAAAPGCCVQLLSSTSSSTYWHFLRAVMALCWRTWQCGSCRVSARELCARQPGFSKCRSNACTCIRWCGRACAVPSVLVGIEWFVTALRWRSKQTACMVDAGARMHAAAGRQYGCRQPAALMIQHPCPCFFRGDPALAPASFAAVSCLQTSRFLRFAPFTASR